MHDHPLMRRLAEWRGLMNQVTQLDHPLGDSARHRFNLLQRADHFAIELASTSPAPVSFRQSEHPVEQPACVRQQFALFSGQACLSVWT